MYNRISELKQLQNSSDESSEKKSAFGTNLTFLFQNIIKSSDTTDSGNSETEPLIFNETSTTDSDSHTTNINTEVLQKEAQHLDTLKKFFSKITKIKKSSRIITSNIEQLTRIKHLIIHSISPNKEKNLTQRLENIMNDTKSIINNTQKSLNNLRQSILEFSDISNNLQHSDLQLRQNIYSGLSRDFKNQIHDFRIFQSEYKNQLYDKFSRQIRIIFPDVSEDEINSMLENGYNYTEATIQKITLANPSASNLFINDLLFKTRDIKRIEQSVLELHQLFSELSESVYTQDKEIDHIEIIVNKTKDTIAESNTELFISKNICYNNRKRMVFISVALLLIAFLILSKLTHSTLTFNSFFYKS